MKKTVKVMAIIMASSMVISVMPVTTANAAGKKAVKWTLNQGVLTVSGKGNMPKTMKFTGDKRIKKVIIKKGVTSITEYAFAECKNLETVNIANTVKKLERSCFRGTAISKITIPSTVKMIENEVLLDCNKLKTVTMPGNFQYVFNGCEENVQAVMSGKGIRTINFNTNLNINNCQYIEGSYWNVNDTDPKYQTIKGAIYSKNGKKIIRIPSGRKKMTLDSGCTTFTDEALFYTYHIPDEGDAPKCNQLVKLNLANATKIELSPTAYKHYELYNMKLRYILFDEGMDTENLETLLKMLLYCSEGRVECFRYIEQKLANRIKVQDQLKILDDKIVIGVNQREFKTGFTIPEGITKISDLVFWETDLSSVTLPSTLTEIGAYAFVGCPLKEIVLPENLKIIGANAFYDTDLTKIEIPNCVETIKEGAFSRARLEEAVLPENMVKIPKHLFEHCSYLTTVNIPEKITEIQEGAFSCTKVGVQKILSNKNLKTIGKEAFKNTVTKDLTIPAHIKKIGKEAFIPEYDAKVTFTIEGNTAGYHVKAFSEAVASGHNFVKLAFTKEIKQSFTHIFTSMRGYNTKHKRNELDFMWTKVNNIDGYEIKVSHYKKFNKDVKKYTAKKTATRMVVKIQKNNKKYVKIRPYKIVNKKRVYGKWTMDSI